MKDTIVQRVDFASVLEDARGYASAGLEQVQSLMESVAAEAPGKLSGYLQDLLTRKGKRVRSTFLLLLAQTGNGFDLERTARVCAAIELIHLGSLIHDDIIDGSDLRRNEKTAHQRWGNRMALLMGDYAMAKAMEMIWEESETQIPLSLCRASSRLIKAEVLEVEYSGRRDLKLEEYLEIIEGKTAALLEACGECGVILAGFSPEDSRLGAALGRNFGIAFQIVDDLLDYGFGAGQLDKRMFSDIKNGFSTLPLILYFENCNPTEREQMLSLLDKAQMESTQMEIHLLLHQKDAFHKAHEMAVERVQAGLPFLASLPDSLAAQHLRQLCTLMTERTL